MTDEKESPSSRREKSSENNSEESRHKPLERLSTREENTLRIQADLDRIHTENMLAQVDVGMERAQELTAIEMDLPSIAEIEGSISNRLSNSLPSSEDIEKLLDIDKIGDIAIEGRSLKEILNEGITSPEQRKMMQRGITFLKLRKYNEAAEWWLLNRPENTPNNSRLHLMLTLFLALTYKLSGNEAGADSALIEAKNNRLFKKLE